MFLLLVLFIIVCGALSVFGLRDQFTGLSRDKLVSGLRSGAARYPATLLVAVAATSFAVAWIFRWSAVGSADRVLAVLGLSIPLSYGIARLVEVIWPRTLLANMLAAAFCLVVGVWIEGSTPSAFMYRMATSGLCAMLLLSFVQVWEGHDNERFWKKSRRIGFLVSFSLVVGAVLAFGVNSIVFSVAYLFEFSFSERVYGTLTAVCGLFVPTLVFLTFVTEDVEDDSTVVLPAISIIKDGVLTPLLFVYTLVLYAYSVQILISSELPKGMVGWMVSAYAAIGLCIWLLSYPKPYRASRVAQLFCRSFYMMVLPLLVLLAVALWERTQQYGITEDRYYLAAFLVWFSAVSFSRLFWRDATLRFIPGSLLLILALSSFGGWSAFEVSQKSQSARFAKYLAALEITAPSFQKPAALRKVESEVELSRVCDYLAVVHGKDVFLEIFSQNSVLQDWLNKATEPRGSNGFFGIYYSHFCKELLPKLGAAYFEAYDRGQPSEILAINVAQQYPIRYDVRGYEYLIPAASIYEGTSLPGTDRTVRIAYKDTQRPRDSLIFELRSPTGTIEELNFTEAVLTRLAELQAQGVAIRNPSSEQMTFELNGAHFHARVVFTFLHIRNYPESPEFHGMNGALYVKLLPAAG